MYYLEFHSKIVAECDFSSSDLKLRFFIQCRFNKGIYFGPLRRLRRFIKIHAKEWNYSPTDIVTYNIKFARPIDYKHLLYKMSYA